MATPPDGVLRPTVEQFNHFLPNFLGNRPDLKCPKGCVSLPSTYKQKHHNIKTTFSLLIVSFNSGLGAYDTAVVKDANGEIIGKTFVKSSQSQMYVVFFT